MGEGIQRIQGGGEERGRNSSALPPILPDFFFSKNIMQLPNITEVLYNTYKVLCLIYVHVYNSSIISAHVPMPIELIRSTQTFLPFNSRLSFSCIIFRFRWFWYFLLYYLETDQPSHKIKILIIFYKLGEPGPRCWCTSRTWQTRDKHVTKRDKTW